MTVDQLQESIYVKCVQWDSKPQSRINNDVEQKEDTQGKRDRESGWCETSLAVEQTRTNNKQPNLLPLLLLLLLLLLLWGIRTH